LILKTDVELDNLSPHASLTKIPECRSKDITQKIRRRQGNDAAYKILQITVNRHRCVPE
jgi:hypothetical protein